MSSDGADVTSGGRLFQTWEPATGKALSPTEDRLNCDWMRRLVLAERRARRLGKSSVVCKAGASYAEYFIYNLYFAKWQQTDNKTTKIIKQLNHRVNASESTAIKS